ncbi:hypothetical protein MAUB_19700 [Mycolicibacterium aubagnense]|uniref:Uncharacterized protein n=1 Tax=Mycolicibacterium aubagnense TaxID=319707 RepID=A0ABM7IB04_9MYCO|nr:hypothetical protein C1S80_21640 [Mycolicibacterium aubagnense]BBX84097.1 hypothetical protein MAUB_19700 [Mycolicibacterium aubagnense]
MVAIDGGLARLRSRFDLRLLRWRERIARQREQLATGTESGRPDSKRAAQPYFHGQHECLFRDAAMQREMYRL